MCVSPDSLVFLSVWEIFALRDNLEESSIEFEWGILIKRKGLQGSNNKEMNGWICLLT